ncbi:hypothetical protein QTI33_26710 [Variovorax sp. J22P271]|uniref:hypothetical protein n=1 Tax=Variovorax davisae TaxID=3053515 RepID=UPI00257677E3|nr:hypothetical protein [Variovorax sp. J22P271]MDM0035752.1 hypothetical protein [Variovorax sp. J22P271]
MPASTGLVPLEKLRVPPALDGRAGRSRLPQAQCLLDAEDDRASLVRRRDVPATQRTCRKEAERLLLWSILERSKTFSSLGVDDAAAYLGFLADPPSHWCGRRHHQRWSPLWRPLKGSLSRAAQRQAVTILRTLFAFLMAQGYLVGNPFAGIAMPNTVVRPLGSQRSLTMAQWQRLNAVLDDAQDDAARRRAGTVRWLSSCSQ